MIDLLDYRLLKMVQKGIPMVERPYDLIGQTLSISEQEVMNRLKRLHLNGTIKRWGVIVKHRSLGYTANAMIVFDIPDHRVEDMGLLISRLPYVNLCYQRPRRDGWNYNLYCMIHGKNQDTVLSYWQMMMTDCELNHFATEILFSKRCFKQTGAQYGAKNDGRD
jgi:siroheme decarboxylase